MDIREKIRRHCPPMEPVPTALTQAGQVPAGREIRAVLFDIYGTLLQSASGDIGEGEAAKAAVDRLNEAANRYPISVFGEDLPGRRAAAVREQHANRRRAGIPHPEVEIREIWQQILRREDPETLDAFALEYELIVNPAYPMPGMRETIDSLAAAGIRLGIVSNAQFYTQQVLEIFLESSLSVAGFDPALLFFSYRFGRAKPDSFLFQEAAKALRRSGVLPESTLYVGNDMRNDVNPAKETGFLAALFAGDDRSLRLRTGDPGIAEVTPDLIITALSSLPSIVEASKPPAPDRRAVKKT